MGKKIVLIITGAVALVSGFFIKNSDKSDFSQILSKHTKIDFIASSADAICDPSPNGNPKKD